MVYGTMEGIMISLGIIWVATITHNPITTYNHKHPIYYYLFQVKQGYLKPPRKCIYPSYLGLSKLDRDCIIHNTQYCVSRWQPLMQSGNWQMSGCREDYPNSNSEFLAILPCRIVDDLIVWVFVSNIFVRISVLWTILLFYVHCPWSGTVYCSSVSSPWF